MFKLWTKPPVPGDMASKCISSCQYIVILCWYVIRWPRSFVAPQLLSTNQQTTTTNYYRGETTWCLGDLGAHPSRPVRQLLTAPQMVLTLPLLIERKADLCIFLLAAHFHSVPFSRQFISTWIFLYIFTRLLFCQQFIFTQL